MKKIGVFGGGAWGTALALAAIRAGMGAWLWVRSPEQAAAMRKTRLNKHLPRKILPDELQIVDEPSAALDVDAVFLAPPAQFLRDVCRRLAPCWRPGIPAVICAKGIEQNSGALMSEIAASELPPGTPLACLSGPTFADEVAHGLPTALTLACADQEIGRTLTSALGTRTFRPYWSPDLIGVEVGGAVKNVLAIACGVVAGRGLGNNARAALMTRGVTEMSRLGVAKGGRAETAMGLSGMGDLILTATSLNSRNFSLGYALGEGVALEAILSERKSVTEGVFTASAVVVLARKMSVDMPVCMAVDALLHHGAALDAVAEGLMSRPFRNELEHTFS